MITAILNSIYFTFIIRLILACILGGLIGFERETAQQPAGFRTYILVCVGAALVMITSQYMFTLYGNIGDPARLGAQIISGIGFLGAGTIIRDGTNVKGLTTAASLWAVSCVGIAIGIGFYLGAITATILIYITLIVLKKMENRVKREFYNILYIEIDHQKLSCVNEIFEAYNAKIRNIEMINIEDEIYTIIKIKFKLTDNKNKLNIISDLYKLEGIRKVSEES